MKIFQRGTLYVTLEDSGDLCVGRDIPDHAERDELPIGHVTMDADEAKWLHTTALPAAIVERERTEQ